MLRDVPHTEALLRLSKGLAVANIQMRTLKLEVEKDPCEQQLHIRLVNHRSRHVPNTHTYVYLYLLPTCVDTELGIQVFLGFGSWVVMIFGAPPMV